MLYPADFRSFTNSLGIGRMMANTMAENGATKVYIIGRREDKLEEAAARHPGYVNCVLWSKIDIVSYQ